MATWLLSTFVLAALAPWLHRLLRAATPWVLATYAAAMAVCLATWAPQVADGATPRLAWTWAAALGMEFSLRLDGWGLLMAIVISGVGATILLYGGGYLAGDRRLGSFYMFLLLFMGSMLGVALADNLLLMFVFWELTSLSSYLLIGFDHERPAARAAALQALLVTGLGGLALLAAVVLMGVAGGSYEFSSLLSRGDAIRGHASYPAIIVLVLLGAFTKSAQFPFHFWLPNAMEAPTPVSAYLHSATMVKAGVFLLARLTPILGGTAAWQVPLMLAGGATMLLGAVMALGSDTLKRILAYSTVSVLGTLTMLIGVGTPAALHAAVVMLLAHALYKGALFMIAGAVSHATHEYEPERLGGLARIMPWTATSAGLAALSMCGLPPAFGFIAKEAFYESTLGASGWSTWLTSAAVLGNVLLIAVALRVGVMPFAARATQATTDAHEVSLTLWLGPALLAAIGILIGLSPAVCDARLVVPAGAAIGAGETPPRLALWHGVGPALYLSGLTVAVGCAAFAMRRAARLAGIALRKPAAWGPESWYHGCVAGMNAVATWQTRVLQNGYLRVYLWTTLVTAVGLVGYALLRGADLTDLPLSWDLHAGETVVCALILLATAAAVRARARLAAIALLGAVGYGVALIFVFFGAPDLAMTQFLIETLLVILFVLVFYHLPPFVIYSERAARTRDAIVATAFGGMMALLVMAIGGGHDGPRVSDYFAERSLGEAHGRNVVNVILVDFRAIDTLGEITVLAAAAAGVYALLRLRGGRARLPRIAVEPRTTIGSAKRERAETAGT